MNFLIYHEQKSRQGLISQQELEQFFLVFLDFSCFSLLFSGFEKGEAEEETGLDFSAGARARLETSLLLSVPVISALTRLLHCKT